ncbi:MAG: Rne/Rng family ribonuclease [Planctomycetota bacterium]
MLINAIDPEESRIAVVEDGVLQELHVELANREAYLGNIYKGKVVNIEPSIGAAFVAFGGRVNGFLHVSDVLPAYGRDDFRLEDVIEGRARVDVDDGPESMQQALSDDDDDEQGDAKSPAEAEAAGQEDLDDADSEHPDDDPSGGDHSEGLEDPAAEQEEPEIEAVEDVEIDDGSSADDAEERDDDGDLEDDHAEDGEDEDHPGGGGGGFGGGVGEKPLRMAASDPGDREESSGGGEAQGGGESSASDAADGAGGEAPTSPRKKRSRRSRSRRKPAAETGDEGAAVAAAPAPDDEAGADVASDRSSAGGSEAGRAESGRAESGGAGSGEADARRSPPRKKRARRGTKSTSGGWGESGGPGGGRRPSENRPTIDQLLRKGQEVVVQITKEGIGNKGPTLTTYVSLPGRCLVLMPSLPKCGVSRKIEDGKERRRLKRIVKELDETGSGGIGFIVRTAGINKSLEDLHRDRDYLKKIWEMVAQRLKVTKAPALLYQESDLVLKAMRDQFTPDIADVVVDSEDVYLRIRDFAEKLMPLMSERIKQHTVTTPLFHSFGIEKDVEELYQPQVDLSNGASIVIDQAEALVAIDVNSGKYKGSGGSDDTAYRTNLESIPEIVRQLRLRDLGGLIIIDFIDMNAEKQRRGVERKIIDALRGDRARIKVGRISPFGMMELTRQRVGPGLKRTVFMQCPHCHGAGWSRTVQSKALSVLRESRALVNLKGYSMLQVFVAPPVADYLVNYKRRAVLDLEDAVGKTILFRPEQSYPIDVVHYRFLTGDGQEARIAIPAGLGVKA